jgi:hypothetical protein
MGSPVEVIPGWSAVSEKLDNTLVQLTRLLHYYADETPPADLQDPHPTGKKVKTTLFYSSFCSCAHAKQHVGIQRRIIIFFTAQHKLILCSSESDNVD